MKFEVSIIIPSYNRYPLNLLSLYALENQTFDLSKMEVIFIDDASTDKTPLLKKYRPPYPFKYVRNNTNLGVSCTRNIGIKMARGKIIIFLDAEIIVDPDYVKNNYRHHLTNENLVVIRGKVGAKLYTTLFPGFNSEQINDICHLEKNRPFVNKQLEQRLQQKINANNLRAFTNHLKEPIQLLDKKDIKILSRLQSFSVPKKPKKIFVHLGRNFNRSPLRWMACSGSLSLKKSLVDMIGGYDEDFVRWGPEDAEFAYRLYKAGAEFIVEPNLKRYHQEHPHTANKKLKDKKNWLLFQQKHPVLDVYIRSLNSIQKRDFAFMDRILQEYQSLSRKFPGRFEDFINSILSLLQQITILESQNKPVRNLLQSSGIGNDPKRKKLIFSKRNTLKSYGKYDNLVRLFDLLTSR